MILRNSGIVILALMFVWSPIGCKGSKNSLLGVRAPTGTGSDTKPPKPPIKELQDALGSYNYNRGITNSYYQNSKGLGAFKNAQSIVIRPSGEVLLFKNKEKKNQQQSAAIEEVSGEISIHSSAMVQATARGGEEDEIKNGTLSILGEKYDCILQVNEGSLFLSSKKDETGPGTDNPEVKVMFTQLKEDDDGHFASPVKNPRNR